MKGTQVFLLALVMFVMECEAEDIPSFIHVCQRNEPNMYECFKSAGEQLRPHLVTGVPEYDIPSLEPLVMNELIKEQSAGLTLTATEVKAWGCSDYFIRSLKIDMDKQTYDLEVDLPLLRIEARYNVSGKIMVMPIRGEGPMWANVTNCKAKAFLQGELFDKGGETYLKYTSMSMKVDVGGGQVKVENLFNGDKFLSDIVNETINKNLGAFFSELMPVIERALSTAFLNIGNKIVERFTFNQLFPN